MSRSKAVGDIGTQDTVGLHILNRLEGLPFTRYHRRIVAVVATAYLFDAMDVAILTFVLAPISSEFDLTKVQTGAIASASFIGMAIGSIGGGWLSDRFGRRPVFTASMLVWGTASLLTAFSWDFSSLLGFRFLTGIGMGAELPCAIALLSEFLPAARRGKYLGLAHVVAVIAYLGSGCATLLLGWRGAFLLMFVLSLFALVVRRGLPESIRWQVAHKKYEKAAATLKKFGEQPAGEATAPDVVQATVVQTAVSTRGPLRDLFQRGQRAHTTTAWAMWFFQFLAQSGINIWIAKMLVDRGASVNSSIGMTMFIFAWGIPGALLASVLLERLGRRPVYAASTVMCSTAALWYGTATSAVMVIVAGSVMYFCLSAMSAGLYAYTPELFGTGARALGTGTASAAGRIGAVIGPLMIPALLVTWGYVGTFVAISACLFTAAAFVLVLGRETRGKSLESLAASHEEQSSQPRARIGEETR
ncbi:MFS transporter [Rhodococcus sp. USK10]|uniref:MFS transporter n=1 Tax=Rhodococcus sp. USK10 TaxID=2789739 RepID=UPI001C604D93|nr:MFS transporter [Rhodococcus sp. USK10]QYB04249.1 MFS transporter [Rhodococcus sp. USK10]